MARTCEEHARSILRGVVRDIDKRVREGYLNDERNAGPLAATAQREMIWSATVDAITAEFNRRYMAATRGTTRGA